MSIRSTTGCYACKTRRKKCDEAKPKCLRCTKNRGDCEYEYIPITGRSTKERTKPAPRPASEQIKKHEKQQGSLPVAPEQTAPIGLFDYPSVPSFDISLPLDVDWEAAFCHPATMPSLDPLTIRAVPFSSVVSQQIVAPPRANLTPDQASLLNALFSLGETNYSQQSNSHSNYTSTLSSSGLEQKSCAPHTHEWVSFPQHASVSNSQLHEFREPDDDEDPEGIKQIFCPTSLRLDRTVDSNSLPFVLQSFAQWIPLTVFDPLKVLQPVKEAIVDQFSQSLASRSQLFLISELILMLKKSWSLDERGKRKLRQLTGEIRDNITGYQIQEWPVSENERQRASASLDNIMELITIQIITTPFSDTLRLLQSAAPVFLSACPPPHPPHLSQILLEPGINLRYFAALDISTSITTAKPLLCRYHVPWSLELCDQFMKRKDDQGLQWLIGIPDQFILLFGYMNGLKEDAESIGAVVNPRIIAQIEEDIKMINILPCEGRDPSLEIGRMVVRECWREVVFIYLYMALCGAHALDPRVKKAQKGFMKLVNGMKPRRNPDKFLVIPMIIAGVATTKRSHRQTIRSRILGVPDCANPNTMGNDALLMLEDVWVRTALEGRVGHWEDLREARRRVTGI